MSKRIAEESSEVVKAERQKVEPVPKGNEVGYPPNPTYVMAVPSNGRAYPNKPYIVGGDPYKHQNPSNPGYVMGDPYKHRNPSNPAYTMGDPHSKLNLPFIICGTH